MIGRIKSNVMKGEDRRESLQPKPAIGGEWSSQLTREKVIAVNTGTLNAR